MNVKAWSMTGTELYGSLPFRPGERPMRLRPSEPKGKGLAASLGAGSGEGGGGLGSPGSRHWGAPRLVFALALLLAACLSAAPALCGTVIAVTPTRIPLRLAPGEACSGAVDLINQGDEAAVLRPWVAAVTVDEAGTTVFSRDETCSWLDPGRADITIAPDARESCPFTVNVPEDAAPGAYRLALSFEPDREDGGSVGFTGGVAVLVELDIVSAPAGTGGGSATGAILAGVAAALAAATTVFLLTRTRGKRAPGKVTAGGET